jgi:type I restriction enzyme S subunit
MKLIKLTDVFRVGSSKRVLKADWKESGVPFYRGREITRLSKTGFADNELFISESHFAELSARYGVPIADDIMVTAIGTIGNTYIVNESDRFYFKDASVLWLHKKAEVDSRFINYWLKSDFFFEQLDKGNGATVDTLTIEKLSNVELLLPSPEVQREIVEKLDRAFSEIDSLEANFRLLEISYDELLHSVQRFSYGSNVSMVKIGEVCKLMTGGTPSRTRKDFFNNGTVKWLVSGDIHKGEIFDCEGRITVEAMKSANTKFLPMNSVMIALNGQGKTRGTVALLRTEATCNQSLVSISPASIEELMPEFLFYNLKMRYQELRRMTGDDGNDRRGLNMILIREIEIPLPSIVRQIEIVNLLKSAEHSVQELKCQIELKKQQAKDLRKSLLSKSFNEEAAVG